MLIFETAFDESWDANPQHTLAIAGYLADVDSWARFSDKWQDALDKHPPMRSPFKMSNFATYPSSKTRFFTKDEYTERLFELADIILAHTTVGIFDLVRPIDYSEIMLPVLSWHWKMPWAFSFSSIVKKALFWVHENKPGTKVKVIFDDVFKNKRQIVEIYETLIDVIPDHLRELLVDENACFGNDRTFRPLQAADMLAWHTRNSRDTGQDHTCSPRLCDGPLVGETWTRKKLSLMARFLPHIPTATSREDRRILARLLWDGFNRN